MVARETHHMADELRPRVLREPEPESELLDAPIDSPALSRLIDEVRSEGTEVSRSYNRTYNRHNR
jgi:hypothetical protein